MQKIQKTNECGMLVMLQLGNGYCVTRGQIKDNFEFLGLT